MTMGDEHRRTKRPVTVIAGPTGHPFHPILVTVPIGAWVASLVFDVVSTFADEPETFATGSLWLIGLGVVGAVIAAIWGFLDLLTIPTGTKAFRTAITHMVLNLSVAVLFAVSFVLRRGDTDEQVSTGLIVLSVVALGALGISGWLGGKLSYSFGIRVVEDEVQADAFLPGD